MRIALAGDTMLGRGVAEAIARGEERLIDDRILDVTSSADLFLLNLECCISERGERWRAANKRFFFRAPPRAAELLAEWGVDCVSLANNHALDYGPDALLDTLRHLESAGIATVGAGAEVDDARAPRWLTAAGRRVAVVAASDHPADYAAGDHPGIAYADLEDDMPAWLRDALQDTAAADVRLCMVHWGPNMTAAPVAHVHRAAAALRAAGATLTAGTSAHVPHGAADGVLYDLGDFVDDYAVHPRLRNDLGLLFLVELPENAPPFGEALPLKLDYCRTGPARAGEARLITERFAEACRALGGDAEPDGGRAWFRLG